ncbi:uncharacterized protein LOC123910641 [Trifolium pratense]|uniref:Uncharacterized protein n=1 Tax=Trifolium pratense TaxID=57577 RepID=A0ACB0IFS4_TRIPR|nr:uncharacterized protein LOC123910641 [Trifolium pratense]CAJ2631158.1 unnamed protein product [Trifolium pratense]
MVRKTIHSFFKRKERNNDEVQTVCHTPAIAADSDMNVESVGEVEQLIGSTIEQPPLTKVPRIEQERINIDTLIRDPGKRPQIWNYCVNQQDRIRTEYIKFGPYQFFMDVYPLSGQEDHPRRFQARWFKTFTWLKCYEDFKNHSCHIETVLSMQIEQQILSNRLRLKASIDAVRWLTFLGCDEKEGSRNRGNFIQMVKFLAAYNKEVVLENAPKNAKYTSPDIQKEILHVIARKVQCDIRKEIGNAKFCLLVDEARDESKREQMALVIRFVDKNGFVQERFLDIIHVDDTTSSTLKQEVCSTLSRLNLDIQNV